MKVNFLKRSLFVVALAWSASLSANQTATITPVNPSQKDVPFQVKIKRIRLTLPNGIHSGVSARHKGKWLFLAGRTNGMHGFNPDPFNFPVQKQNRMVYVVDVIHKTIKKRSLDSPRSGLTVAQIDSLSVTSPQSYQKGKTLYITGGYGINTATNQFETKNLLTAIDVPGLISWVEHNSEDKHASHYIRQLAHPIFQVTGGYMEQIDDNPTLLVFGQNFTGTYFLPPHTQVYTEQVRRFRILDNGKKLRVSIKSSEPKLPDPNYRRRDLNVINTIKSKDDKLVQGLIALSGVFTPPPDDGAWTVPVEITAEGKPSMANPALSRTFKQGMNNYASATMELFSEKTKDMYSVLLGGITFGYFENGQFKTDPELPFTNQVTTIKINKHGRYKQFLMKGEYPKILSTMSNPGNRLLFGSGAFFMPAEEVELYDNDVVKLDSVKKSKVIGYIVGGIQSTLPNTNSMTDSAASPYIFKVIVEPK